MSENLFDLVVKEGWRHDEVEPKAELIVAEGGLSGEGSPGVAGGEMVEDRGVGGQVDDEMVRAVTAPMGEGAKGVLQGDSLAWGCTQRQFQTSCSTIMRLKL